MEVAVYFILLGSLVASIYYYFTRHYNYWKKRGIKGPKPEFFFGNFKEVVLQRKTIHEKCEEFYLAYPKEKVVGVYRMGTRMMLVRDLDIIQHIMIKDFDNFIDRATSEFGTEGIAKNLFTTSGENWRVLRTRLSPIFTSGKLKNMFHLINKCGDDFMDHIDSVFKGSSEQNAYPLVQMFTIASISACAFGLDIDMKNYDKETYDKLDKILLTPTYLMEIEHVFPGLINFLHIETFPKPITKFFYNLVRTIVKQRNGKPTNRRDFMDLLLEMRNAGEIVGPKKHENDEQRLLKIDDDLLAAQAFVFYTGGYETSASTMSYLLHELALNPDIQDKIVREIDEVLGKNDNVLSYDCLKDMTYLAQVFDEVLRMYPIVDPLHRKSMSTFQVPGTDIIIEKDIVILLSVRGVHYDEKYYPDPHKFDPDRFSPENVKSRHPCAYLPFGVGSRNCIGMRFSKVQSTVLMIKLLRQYRIVPASTTRRGFIYNPTRITLTSIKGYPVKFIPRNKS